MPGFKDLTKDPEDWEKNLELGPFFRSLSTGPTLFFFSEFPFYFQPIFFGFTVLLGFYRVTFEFARFLHVESSFTGFSWVLEQLYRD